MIDKNSFFIVSILCLQTVYNCLVSTIGQYIYGYFLTTYPYPNDTRNGTNQIDEDSQCAVNTTTASVAQSWAQQQSAELLFRMTLWRAFPVIIVTYLFGLYSSRFNRRIVLVISILGNTIHVVIYQGIIYRYLDEYWWYASAFIAGLAGGTNIISIIMNLVITETTDEHQRSSRFVRLGAITTALSSLASFLIGYYIQWRGFIDILWMSIGLELLTIFIVILFVDITPTSMSLRLEESPIDETTSLLSTNNISVEIKQSNRRCFSECFDMCRLFHFRRNSSKKSISLMLILSAYAFHLLASSSTSILLWFLLNTPFCWTSKDLGNYSAISLILSAALSVIVMNGLTRCGVKDALICALGHFCFSAYTLWIALAKHSWQLYLALLINPFTTYPSALTLPMISKLLEVHERENIFTLVTEINTIILAFGSSICNWIYARTVTFDKSFTLYLGSGISIIPFVLSLLLFIVTRSHNDPRETNESIVRESETATLSLSNHIPPPPTNFSCLCASTRSLTDSYSIDVDENMRIFIFEKMMNKPTSLDDVR